MSQTTQEAAELLKSIMVDRLGVEPDAVVAEANLREDLGFDSIDLAELLAAMEKRTGIEIDESKLETVVTVGDVLGLMSTGAGGHA